MDGVSTSQCRGLKGSIREGVWQSRRLSKTGDASPNEASTEVWRPVTGPEEYSHVVSTAPALERRGWFHPYRASGRDPDHRHPCRDRHSVVPEPEEQGHRLGREGARAY